MAEDSDSNKEDYLEDEEDFSLKIADGDDGSDYNSSSEKRKRKKSTSKSRKKKTPKKKSKEVEKQVKVTVKLSEPSSSVEPSEMSDEEEIGEEKTRKKRRSKKIVEIDPNTPPEEQLPIKFGTSQVVSLGKIEYENENYHNDRYIFPIGYKAEKNYISYQNTEAKTVYVCEILDGGEEGPTFKITPADDNVSYTSSTPSGVWSLVIKKVNESRKKSSKTCTVSGPEYYGLSNNRIRQLIEMLPDADKCVNYKKKFSNNDGEAADTTETAPAKRGRRKKEAKESSSTTETPKRKRASKKDVDEDEEEEDTSKKKKKKAVKQEEVEEEVIEEEMEEAEPTVDFPDPLYTDEGLSEPVLTIYREDLPILREYQFTNYTENITEYSGHNEKVYLKFNMYTAEEVQEIYKEKQTKLPPKVETALASSSARKTEAKQEKSIVEKYEKEETRSSIEILRSMWELPYVFMGFLFLRPIIKITDFDFDEFEDSLINPKECNGLLADVFIRLIKGPAIDRKTLANLDPKSYKWKSILKTKLDLLPPMYWLWQVNPLILHDYDELTPSWRLIIIKALMEWKFDTNQRVYDYSRSKYGITMLQEALGTDRDGIKYWYFPCAGRLFTELPASLESKTKPRWELKCSTKSDFTSLLEELEEEEEPLVDLIESIKLIIGEIPEPEENPVSIEEKRKAREELLAVRAKEREEEEREMEKRHELEAKEFEIPEPESNEAELTATPSDSNNGNTTTQTLTRSGRSVKNIDFASLADEDELDDSKRSLRPRKRKSYKEAVQEEDEKKIDKDAEFVLDEEDHDEDDEDFYSEEEEDEDDEDFEDTKKSKNPKKGNSKKVDLSQFKNDPSKRGNPHNTPFTNVSGVNLNPLNRSAPNMQQIPNRNMMQQRVNKPQTVIMSGSTVQNNLRDAQTNNLIRNQLLQQLANRNLQQQLANNPALQRQLLTALQNNPNQQQQILQALQMRQAQQMQQQNMQQNIPQNMQQQNIQQNLQQSVQQNMQTIPNAGNLSNITNMQQNVSNIPIDMTKLTPSQLSLFAQMSQYHKQQNPMLNQQQISATQLSKMIQTKGADATVNNTPTVINQNMSQTPQPTILNPATIQHQPLSQNQNNNSNTLLQLLQLNTASNQQPQQPFTPLLQQNVAIPNTQPIMNQIGSSSQPQQDQSDMDNLFFGEESFI